MYSILDLSHMVHGELEFIGVMNDDDVIRLNEEIGNNNFEDHGILWLSEEGFVIAVPHVHENTLTPDNFVSEEFCPDCEELEEDCEC